jgi:hypothetical protein
MKIAYGSSGLVGFDDSDGVGESSVRLFSTIHAQEGG